MKEGHGKNSVFLRGQKINVGRKRFDVPCRPFCTN